MMSDLRNNDALAKLRDQLIRKPEQKKEISPEQIAISISENQMLLFCDIQIAHVIGDSKHRPALHVRGDRLFLVKEAINKENSRRIGSHVEDGRTVRFSFEYGSKPELAIFLQHLQCGKSLASLNWFSDGVWQIEINEENLRERRTFIKLNGQKQGNLGVPHIGVLPRAEGDEDKQQMTECTEAAAENAPAHPEPTEEVKKQAPIGSSSEIGRLRDMLAEVNQAKKAMGDDLRFSLDEHGLIHATLHLI